MTMRRLMAAGAVAAALALPTACSDGAPLESPTGGTSAPAGASAVPPAATPSPAPALGVAEDKEACKTIVTKLSEWGVAFGEAAAGIGNAGSDVEKVEAVVKEAKSANSKFAADLRAVASKTDDAEVKKVANDLAAALEKINTQLDAEKIAKDPGMLSTAFDLPEYAAAADAYERVCAGA